ncbi:hypothetical protein NO559_08925 [Dasania sp. GY-MA-18]|uniref:Uncharacterized protein n=1 Tax=Dasania phycosphaerae TaxID=2950436 RepID=A0A9J6RLL1_9GAMM|nr:MULTISPECIES: hypothetical protein [Dasania]MCR8922893.1 hypothetical protein [Dasania sp. GY-MA-18]MCZ0865324.1 hypothetical protein [Dasania phycosphaerae]MCZ0869049.1 hypothetical protein [Dasania phycosphaerae]
MKNICLFLSFIFLMSCTNVAGWAVRLNNGVYTSQSAEFTVKNPIDSGFCLKIEEDVGETSETVGFHECHGYIAERYMLTWYKIDSMDEEQFFEKTEKSFIPSFSKNVFNPIDEGVAINISRLVANGNPAVSFEVKTKSGDKLLMLKSTSVLYGNRVLSISVAYDLSRIESWNKPGSKKMFDIYDSFVSSFKRI